MKKLNFSWWIFFFLCFFHRRSLQTTAGADGMPIGIQIIGLPYNEEIVLHGMNLIDSIKNV